MTSMTTYNHPCPSRIKKLPPLLINQLAAGEIVTRPASVVKELLENAIDAGATQIEIKVTGGGMGMIEVSDDGCGIHPDDMVMAVTRHATSKIADIANLQGVQTLGFRGEALASTAAVSRLTLTSSHDDSGIGRQLNVAGIVEASPVLTPVVHSRGTQVVVKDLYFNVPARRGNLKSVATEFAHIEAVVREVAIAYADVSLTLYHNQKKRLLLLANEDRSWADETSNDLALEAANTINRLPLSRLEQALGLALRENSIPILVDLAALYDSQSDAKLACEDGAQIVGDEESDTASRLAQIEGWLWAADQTKTSEPKLIYVNGRLIKDQSITSQLRQTIQNATALNCGYALYFQLPTDWLNVNVHPSKQRIKIHALANIMAHLDYAIKSQLGSFAQCYSSKAQTKSPYQNPSQDLPVAATLQVKEPSGCYQASKPAANLASAEPIYFHQRASLPAEMSQKSSSIPNPTTAQSLLTSHIGAANAAPLKSWQKWPVLVTVIHDDNMLTKLMLDKRRISQEEQLPLLLLYWRDRHYLMPWSSWQLLLEKWGAKDNHEALSLADIYAHYPRQLEQLSAEGNHKISESMIKTGLTDYSIATLALDQLLTMMLAKSTK